MTKSALVRSVLCATLMILLVGSGVWAQDATLDPMAAIKRALEFDESLMMARLTLENARVTYEKNVAANLGGSPHTLRTAEIEWLKAMDTYNGQVADTVISVVQQIIGLKQSEMAVAVDEKRLGLSQLSYDRAVQRRQAQIASESELIEAELSLIESKLAYEGTLHDAARERLNFAKRLGLDDVTIVGGFEFVPVEVDLEETLELVMTDHLGLLDVEHRRFLAELELNRLRLEQAPPVDILVASNDLQLAVYRVESTEEQVTLEVENTIRAIERAEQNYQIALRRTEIERERFENTKKQVEAGFVTEESLVSAEINLLQRESALLESLKTYLVAVLNYEKLIGADLTAGVLVKGGN